jgi:hypothetical protein
LTYAFDQNLAQNSQNLGKSKKKKRKEYSKQHHFYCHALVCNHSTEMPNQICEKCKQDRPQDADSAVKQTGCTEIYSLVEECMKANKGSISICKKQWEDFRSCVAIKIEK